MNIYKIFIKTCQIFSLITIISCSLLGQNFNKKYLIGLGVDIQGIAVDSKQNVYATGQGEVKLGCNVQKDFKSSGSVFLAKIDSIGNVIWVLRYGGDAANTYAIDIDNDDNIVVGGSFEDNGDFSTADFPNRVFTSKGQDDAYIMKCDPDGNILWVELGTGSSENVVFDLVIGENGDIYSTGRFLFGSKYGNVTIDNFRSTKEPFLWAVSSDGKTLWAKNIDSYFTGNGQNIAIDRNGDIVTSGIRNTQDRIERYVFKLSSDGDSIKYLPILFGADTDIIDLTTDSENNIYITGSFKETHDFDPGPEEFLIQGGGATRDNSYVLKLNNEFEFLWAHSTGNDVTFSRGLVLEVDESDNLFVVGHFKRKIDFDPGPDIFDMTTVSGDALHIYIQVLDSSGGFLNAISRGTDSWDNFTSFGFCYREGNYYLASQIRNLLINARIEAFGNGKIIQETIQETICDSFNLDGIYYTSDCFYSTSNIDTSLNCQVISKHQYFVYQSTIPELQILDSVIISNIGQNGFWLDCDNDYIPIDGENSSVFQPNTNGNYAFLPDIPGGICFDTSKCVSFEHFTTSIENINEFDNIIIGPNPTSDILFIKDLPSSQMNISLSSISGSTVLKYISPLGQNDLELDLSNLVRGTYFLKIEGEYTIHYRRVIKL